MLFRSVYLLFSCTCPGFPQRSRWDPPSRLLVSYGFSDVEVPSEAFQVELPVSTPRDQMKSDECISLLRITSLFQQTRQMNSGYLDFFIARGLHHRSEVRDLVLSSGFGILGKRGVKAIISHTCSVKNLMLTQINFFFL